MQQGQPASRRLIDVSRAQPGDVTLQNLLGVLNGKLDICRRLPICEYEAESEGFEGCAKAFHKLADTERESLDLLLTSLQNHLVETRSEGTAVSTDLNELDPEGPSMSKGFAPGGNA